MPRRSSMTLALATLLAVLLTTSVASAQNKWTIIPLNSRGLDEAVVLTFKDLLQNEISGRNGAEFVDVASDSRCADVPCAKRVAKRVGADVVVYGALSSLGKNIIVTVSVVDAGAGTPLSTQKITVDKIEDLESAAERIARAILGGTTTSETAELGNITNKESKPAQRREGLSGLGLRVGMLVPLGESYGDGTPGLVTDFSYWYEARSFAIEPRLGLRFDTDTDEGRYFEAVFDVGAYYLLGLGDFASFLGGGGGMRILSESRLITRTEGTIMVSTQEQELDDSAVGPSVFARAGVLLFRTYTLRVALTVDYNVTFAELNNRKNPQSMTAGIGVMF